MHDIATLPSKSSANTCLCREYSTTQIDVELPRHHRHHKEKREFVFERPHHQNNHLNSRIDIAEREYRSRFQPAYREEVRVETTVDPPREYRSRFQPTYREGVRVETTVDPPKQDIVTDKMGYYDEDGKKAQIFVTATD
jgi:hypothetical protein